MDLNQILKDTIVLAAFLVYSALVFGIELIGVFPVVLILFFWVAFSPDIFFQWYLEASSLVWWKYVTGFFLGSVMISGYIYFTFYRERDLSEIDFRLIFPSALIVISLRWLPYFFESNVATGLKTAYRGSVYLLSFLLLILFIDFKQRVKKSDIADNQRTLKHYTYTNVEIVIDKIENYIRNAPSVVLIRIIRDNRTALLSFLYVTLAMSFGAYIAEEYLIRPLVPVLKSYTVIMVAAILFALIFFERIFERRGLVFDELRYWREEYSEVLEFDLETDEIQDENLSS
jgi:hypothetical protein